MIAAHSFNRICLVANLVFMISTSCGVIREKCETHFLHFTYHYLRFWRFLEVDGLFTIYHFPKGSFLWGIFFPCHKINLQTGKFILHQFEGLHNLWDTPNLSCFYQNLSSPTKKEDVVFTLDPFAYKHIIILLSFPSHFIANSYYDDFIRKSLNISFITLSVFSSNFELWGE